MIKLNPPGSANFGGLKGDKLCWIIHTLSLRILLKK